MKMKNIASLIMITIFIFFLVVYVSEGVGYTENKNYKKNILTNETIKKFEEDVKAKKELDLEKYLEEDKNYKNLYNRLGIYLSNIIEKVFNKGMNKFIKEINKVSK